MEQTHTHPHTKAYNLTQTAATPVSTGVNEVLRQTITMNSYRQIHGYKWEYAFNMQLNNA